MLRHAILCISGAILVFGQTPTLNKNKDVALQFYDFEEKFDNDGIRRIVRSDYIQHTPQAPDYLEPLLKQHDLAKDRGTTPHFEWIRVVAENDLVWMFGRTQGPRGVNSRVDMFRVQDGQIAEHWSVNELLTGKRSNDNDNFALGRGAQASNGPLRVSQPTPLDVREKNKDLVRQFYKLKDAGDFDGLRKIIQEDYIQHTYSAPDKREPLMAVFQRTYQQHNPVDTEIVRMVAEGDQVWALFRVRRPQAPEQAEVGMFRIENGQIAEHWGVYQQVPAESVNHNSFFDAGRSGH